MSLSSPPPPGKQAQGHQAHTLDHTRQECPLGSARALALWAALTLAGPPWGESGQGTQASSCLAQHSVSGSGRAALWPAGSSVSLPAWPAELRPTSQGQDPRLGLCPPGEGIQVAQPLQGPAGRGGQGLGQAASLVLSRSLHADSSGMLQAGRQAGSGQAAGTPGRAGGIRGREGRRQTDGS